jgi:transposase
MPATFPFLVMTAWSVLMAAVMIGVDPHKGSHTAVVISAAEEPLGKLRVRASAGQAEKLVAWAADWPERTWAVEGAAGLGHLLAQQLVAAGEWVLDVQPKLAARVRLLQAGDTNKNDPNDALSVAVAALRSATARPVMAEDYKAVLKVWSKRHRDLARLRNQVACRLHAVLCDLVPGGLPKEISAAQAARMLEQVTPSGAVDQARAELAAEFLGDLRHLDAQLRDTKKKLAIAVKASGTTLTQVFGVGPVIAGTIIGDIAEVSRFPGRDHFAAYNGPHRSRCPRGTGRSTGCRYAVTAASTTRSTWPRSPRSGTGTARAAPTTSGRSQRERHTKRHCGPSNAGSATPSSAACGPTPARPPRAREGNRGATLHPARPAHTPHTSSSDKPLPDPAPAYDPAPRQAHGRRRVQRKPRHHLTAAAKRTRSVPMVVASGWSSVWERMDVMYERVGMSVASLCLSDRGSLLKALRFEVLFQGADGHVLSDADELAGEFFQPVFGRIPAAGRGIGVHDLVHRCLKGDPLGTAELGDQL